MGVGPWGGGKSAYLRVYVYVRAYGCVCACVLGSLFFFSFGLIVALFCYCYCCFVLSLFCCWFICFILLISVSCFNLTPCVSAKCGECNRMKDRVFHFCDSDFGKSFFFSFFFAVNYFLLKFRSKNMKTVALSNPKRCWRYSAG